MIVDYSPSIKAQTQTATPLDHSPLKKFVKEYITNCVIEDKAQGTIQGYSQWLYDMAGPSLETHQ
jgi:hypothetical protein